MQGDHLNRETLELCDITLCAHALHHAGRGSHTHESGWDTEHLGKGGNYFDVRPRAQGSPRWEGRAAARKGLHFCKKFNLQAFTFTREHVHGLLAEYMGLPSARTCMSILREARAGALCAMSPGFCTGQANQIWGHIQVLSRIPSRVQTCIAEP